jgi:hypothetical protein
MNKRTWVALTTGAFFSVLFFFIERYFRGHSLPDSLVRGMGFFLAMTLVVFLVRPLKRDWQEAPRK